MADTIFGHIVVLKKDGSKGCVFDIKRHEVIDADSDICIKLNSVSRKHMKITVDQNGLVSLEFWLSFVLNNILIYFSVRSTACPAQARLLSTEKSRMSCCIA